MTNRIVSVALCALLGLAVLVPATPAAAADAADIDEFLVVFKGRNDISGHLETARDLGGEIVRYHSEIGVAVVRSDKSDYANYLRQDPRVEAVSQVVLRDTNWSARQKSVLRDLGLERPATAGIPEIRAHAERQSLQDPFQATPANSEAPTNGGAPDPTTAPLYFLQWNLSTFGMEDVWAAGKFGSEDVTVALIGAGVDYRHPDLAGKVDLERSVSFVPSDDALVEANFPGAHPVADTGIHSTHVASQITCNLSIMACVAPNVRLVGVKVLNLNELGTIDALVSGILHAANIRAQVIAIPFVYWGPASRVPSEKIWSWSNPDDIADIIAVKLAIAYARIRGSVVIAETGVTFGSDPIDADADGLDVILPAQAGALTITGLGRQKTWGGISNYGFSLVDLGAPGGAAEPPNPATFEESIWGACTSFSLFPPLFEECAIDVQPQYTLLVGSQMAVGHASGVAALVSSNSGGRTHGFFVQRKLLRTAIDIDEPGRDAKTGRGIIDPVAAVLN